MRTPSLKTVAAPLVAIAVACVTTSVAGAEMWHISNHFSAERFVPHIHYSGPVLEGDAKRMAALLDSVAECDVSALPAEGGNCALVTLHSPGGNYIEGLKLAGLFRDRGVATVVETGTSCYSACAFAFLGGSGYSSQDGVGAYSDRIIEPGATLGFHAPYFAPDDLGSLVADFGMDAVLGASREDIALMVEQLVDWNVDPNILGYVVSMGPDQSYDVKTGEDYFLMRSHLPPSPIGHWIDRDDKPAAIRNACLRLMAYHKGLYLDNDPDAISTSYLTDFAVNESGQKLSGFRIGPDNPLGVTFCGLPTEQTELYGDIDLSLFTAPGVTGAARPMLSMFHRPDGWSSLGTGSRADRRLFKKGGFNAMFMAPFEDVASRTADALDYLAFEKFYSFNEDIKVDGKVPRPESRMPVKAVVTTPAADTLEYGDNRIIVQIGNSLLLEQGMNLLPERNVTFNLNSKSALGYVYGGVYPSGRPFLWFGLMDLDSSMVTLVEIEAKSVPADMDAAVTEQEDLACSFSFLGASLKCR